MQNLEIEKAFRILENECDAWDMSDVANTAISEFESENVTGNNASERFFAIAAGIVRAKGLDAKWSASPILSFTITRPGRISRT